MRPRTDVDHVAAGLGATAVAITTFLSLWGGASPGLAALAITSAQSLVQSVYWLCRFISALEVDLNGTPLISSGAFALR
jgi:hypothetical protein